MNGTTLFQTLYATYHDQAVQVAGQTSNQLLNAILPTMRALIGLYVVIFGAGLIQGRIDFGEGIARVVRVLIAVALVQSPNWNTFIVQMFTTTIPDQVSNAIVNGGGTSLKGAQGFDGLSNFVDNYQLQLLRQAVGIWYIPERIQIALAGWAAKAMVFFTFVVWISSQATLAFLLPVGALLAPLILFKATEGYFARFISKLVGLELVGALALLLASFVVQADGAMMQKIGHPTPAAQANQNLTMNAGLTSFTGFDIPGAGPLALGAAAPQGSDNSLNISMSIASLWNIVLSYAFGVMILMFVTAIALFIGHASGFTSAPAVRGVIAAAEKGARAAAATAGAAVRAARR